MFSPRPSRCPSLLSPPLDGSLIIHPQSGRGFHPEPCLFRPRVLPLPESRGANAGRKRWQYLELPELPLRVDRPSCCIQTEQGILRGKRQAPEGLRGEEAGDSRRRGAKGVVGSVFGPLGPFSWNRKAGGRPGAGWMGKKMLICLQRA